MAGRTTHEQRQPGAPAPETLAPDAPMVQLLSADGERIEHPDYPLDISDTEIAAMYRDMAITRRFDTEFVTLQRQGELALWASCKGQEGGQVGAAHAARAHDMIFPSYREHAVLWCRGLRPEQMVGMFRGTSLGGWDPKEHNTAVYALVIGSQTLHATGYAMGVQRDGAVGTGDPDRDTATMVFFGDGATSQGDVNEAFVWAAAADLPVVFFCQNNQWAISAPVQTQSRIPLAQRAAGFGFPGVRVDGNDVLASLAVTRAALDRARSGNGPTLIEAFTYRMGAHTTSDDPTKYREKAEQDEWERRDPIVRVRAYLERSGSVDASFFESVDAEADAVAAAVRAECLSQGRPDPLSTLDHVYVDVPEEFRRQREQFAGYLSEFEGAQA